ncbi:MAG: EamA family transporter, partial [Hyphomicrobiales bacterium]|nr:EamA family transporter [Hyphomicrobiales bacterium]
PSNVTAANLPVALGEAIFQGWFLTFVAFLAYMTLVHRLGPPTAALGIALIPPMGVAIATLVLHETTYPGQWLGASIVVVGLAIAGGVGAGPLGRVVGLRPVP